MKIAYIPQNNPYDKHSWSGTDYYTRLSLEKQGNEVYCIYGFQPKPNLLWRLKRLFLRIFKKHILFKRTYSASRQWANYIKANLQDGTDAIFSLGTLQVACLQTDIPIFIYVDGIFEQMRVEYKWKGLFHEAIKEANKIEQEALDRCSCIISCAIKTKEAISNYYRISNDKIRMVPLGANWDIAPDIAMVTKSIEKRSRKVCKLLFVGVDWFRKGGDIVLGVSQLLKNRGLNVELHVCGISQIPVDTPSFVLNHGFLSKSNKRESEKLKQLFTESHFLFVPSYAEAYGLVFCEASAYGLPSLSHRVGGLTTTIKDGVNGQLFEIGTPLSEFANYIEHMFKDRTKYRALCLSSLQRYNTYLNWDISGKELNKIIMEKIHQ